MEDLNNNKLYFRDPEMILPERGQEVLLKVRRKSENLEQEVLLNLEFQRVLFNTYVYYPALFDGIKFNNANKEDEVVGWMPITEMDNIITDHTHGSLKGFINHHSHGAFIRFEFNIDGEDYKCVSVEDFLLDYGRLKGHLLDEYIVTDFIGKDLGSCEGSIYILELEKK